MSATVLFVDDEPALLAGLRDTLRKEPYEILTAESAANALDLLARRRVDVVVSDEQMPGMGGAALLSLVRQRYPKTIRIILSGQASMEALIRAINEGEIYRFLTKPCAPIQLAQTIRDALLLRTLARESSRLLATSKRRRGQLEKLERENPGLTHVERSDDGSIVLDCPDDVETLIRELRTEADHAANGPVERVGADRGR